MGFYQLLGTLAFHQGDHGTAEQWHLRALEITKKLGKEHLAAGCYYDLAMNVFLGKAELAEAEKWYLKAIRIFKRRRDAHGAAMAYMFLGFSLAHRGSLFQGGRCLSKAMEGFQKTKDTAQAQLVARSFLTIVSKAPTAIRAKLRAIWKKARQGPSAAER